MALACVKLPLVSQGSIIVLLMPCTTNLAHCLRAPCLAIDSQHRAMALRPWFLQLPHYTSLWVPSCQLGKEVGRTRPCAVVATGCTPHMSWSPCVCVLVCHPCVLGTPKVVPWCLSSLSTFKSIMGHSQDVWRRH